MGPGTPHLVVTPRELAVLSSSVPAEALAEDGALAKVEASAEAGALANTALVNFQLSTFDSQLPCFQTVVNSFTANRKLAPVFSYTYKLLSPQMPHFDILTNCRGCHPLGLAEKASSPLPTGINFSIFILLRALLRVSKIQLSCFQPQPHSFTETPGWGYVQ